MILISTSIFRSVFWFYILKTLSLFSYLYHFFFLSLSSFHLLIYLSIYLSIYVLLLILWIKTLFTLKSRWYLCLFILFLYIRLSPSPFLFLSLSLSLYIYIYISDLETHPLFTLVLFLLLLSPSLNHLIFLNPHPLF